MIHCSNSEIPKMTYGSNSEIQIMTYDSNSEIQIMIYDNYEGCNLNNIHSKINHILKNVNKCYIKATFWVDDGQMS
jgi:hypothetical protein